MVCSSSVYWWEWHWCRPSRHTSIINFMLSPCVAAAGCEEDGRGTDFLSSGYWRNQFLFSSPLPTLPIRKIVNKNRFFVPPILPLYSTLRRHITWRLRTTWAPADACCHVSALHQSLLILRRPDKCGARHGGHWTQRTPSVRWRITCIF